MIAFSIVLVVSAVVIGLIALLRDPRADTAYAKAKAQGTNQWDVALAFLRNYKIEIKGK